jgi:hypothetical protein
VILDIREVESDIATGSDVVIFIAPLGESLDDIGFSTQQAEERHHFLAAFANRAQNNAGVFHPSSEDLVLNRICLVLHFPDDWGEGVNNVIT